MVQEQPSNELDLRSAIEERRARFLELLLRLDRVDLDSAEALFEPIDEERLQRALRLERDRQDVRNNDQE